MLLGCGVVWAEVAVSEELEVVGTAELKVSAVFVVNALIPLLSDDVAQLPGGVVVASPED